MPASSVAANAHKVTLVGSGSSAAQTYLEDLEAAYAKTHKGFSIKYNPDGGNAGVTDVQNHRSQFALQTSQPSASSSGTTWDQLFLDAMTISVNKANKLSTISLPNTASIFLGNTTSWGQVNGSGLGSDTIAPFGRNSTAGLYTIFSKAVLGGKDQSSSVTQEESDGLVASRVGSTKDAIGYIGLANSNKAGVKALAVSTKNGGTAFKPSKANIRLWAKDQAKHKSGGYPLTHFDWVVVPKKGANKQVIAFFNWVQSSAAAATVLNKAGAVPYFNK